jgi:hypothetical protein
MMRVGSRVRFQPVDSFWAAPGRSYPPAGSLGTVVRMPRHGAYGGCITVNWSIGHPALRSHFAETDFCGRNTESLVLVVVTE